MNSLKKIITLFCALVFALTVLSSCGKGTSADNPGKTEAEKTSLSQNVLASNGKTKITFSCDKAEAAPGEEVTVTFNVSKAEIFACLSSVVKYDSGVLTCSDYDVLSDSEFHSEVFENDSGLTFFGYVLKTLDLPDNDVFSVTFKVNDKAKSGTKTEITLNVSQFALGKDAEGVETYDVSDTFTPLTLNLNIR